MKHLLRTRCISLIFLLVFSLSTSAEIAVIVHLSNTDKMNSQAISQLFLGQVSSFPSGGVAIPIALARGNSYREYFNATVLKKTENQYKAFWSRLVFTGKAAPPNELDDSEQLRDLVAKNPALIGYIDEDSVDDSVKVIATF